MQEKRRHQRVAVHFDATLHLPAGSHPVVVEDISSGGCKIASEAPFPRGALATLEVRPYGRQEAEVAWAHDGEAGLRFIGDREKAGEMAMVMAVYGTGEGEARAVVPPGRGVVGATESDPLEQCQLENRHLQEIVVAMREELERTHAAVETAAFDAAAAKESEILQLQRAASSVRDAMEVQRADHQDAVADVAKNMEREAIQLRATAQALRDRLETQGADFASEISRVVADKDAELNYLQQTVASVRDELERERAAKAGAIEQAVSALEKEGAELRETVQQLRDQLEEEREAHSRARVELARGHRTENAQLQQTIQALRDRLDDRNLDQNPDQRP